MSIVSGAFNQNITSISKNKSKTAYGDATASVMYSNVPCRWQEINGKTMSESMQIIDYKIDAWVDSAYTVGYDYEVVYGGKTYKVVSFENRFSIGGNTDHVRLFLK
jgi:hypothetical protein